MKIKVVNKEAVINVFNGLKDNGIYTVSIDTVTDIIDMFPVLMYDHDKDNIMKPGNWIQYRKGHYTGVKCSLCDTIMDFTTNYCPKCGADMRGNNNGKETTV